MMKYLLWTAIVLCLLVALLATFMLRGNPNQFTKPNPGLNQNQMKKFDIELNQDSAIKIAEIILVNVYGEKVLDQRPWKITSLDSSFILEGTLPPEYDFGGVALIEISRKNAEVLRIIHGK